MTSYRIRMEGVNFSSFVLDTRDLSTTRGAGLALLRAPRWLQKNFPQLRPISLGASSGLFEVELPVVEEGEKGAPSSIESLCADLRSFLASHREKYTMVGEDESAQGPHGRLPLELATFVVDAVEVAPEPAADGGSPASFQEDRERLLALNRYRQMQSPSVHVHTPEASVGVCALSRVRPAVKGRKGGDGESLSDSVWRRREFGRAMKQDFYEHETGESIPEGFSQSFQQLTHDPSRGVLHSKMAVIYIDGNAFSKLQRRVCTGSERQRAFDDFLQTTRRDALGGVLGRARDDDGFREGRGEGPIRFETLLWGGDDLVWVVPAWRGLQVLASFYAGASAWRLPKGLADALEKGASPLLRQAAGVAFCNHGAPIARIDELIRGLADEAKAGRQRNLVAYEVLESFDHTGDDLAAYRQLRTPPGADRKALLIEGPRLGEVLTRAPSVKAEVPHRKVLELARRRVSDPGGEGFQKVRGQIFQDLSAAAGRRLLELLELLGSGAGGAADLGWLHLAELWDYLPGEGDLAHFGNEPAAAGGAS